MLEALKGLLTPAQGAKIRFRAMTESYDLIDSYAERVDTQLIVHSDSVAVRDRQPVSLYKLHDHDSMPAADSSIIVETGLFRRPEVRSRWVLQEALHIWLGYAEGTLQVAKAKLNFDPKSLRGMSLGVGVAVFMVCVVAAIVIAAVGDSGETTGSQSTSSQGADHGFVEGSNNTAADSADSTGGEEGADPGGDIRPELQDGVVPGEEPSGQGDP